MVTDYKIMKKNNSFFIFDGNSIYYATLLGLFYIVLIVGSTFSVILDKDTAYIYSSLVYIPVIFFILLSRKILELVYFALLFIIPYFLIFLYGLFSGGLSDYGFIKFDSVIFCSVISSPLLGHVLIKNGTFKTIDLFLKLILFILILTVFYKLYYGFFDRSVRFFLNGPIVFGWIMGICSFFSLYLWIILNKYYYLFFSVLFFISLLWTQSKGPIIVTIFLLFFSYLMKKKVRSVIPLSVGIFLLYNLIYFISDIQELERIGAIVRFFQKDLLNSDYGSVGVRLSMYTETIEIIKNNLILGVGLGQWAQYTQTDFLYPHNVFLEIASELGLILFVIFLTVYFCFACKGGAFSAYITLFFSGCMFFSGDISYLRFPITFQLAFLMYFFSKNRIYCKTNEPVAKLMQ